MKKILLPFVCYLLLSFNASSQVRTVSNNVNSPGQYYNLQTAINEANVGDTIYVHGSSNTYPDIVVNKRLTFIGPGFYPSTQTQLTATINIIQLDSIIPTSGGSGSKFIGLFIGYVNKKTLQFWQIDNILFERCRFNASIKTYVNGNNWVFRNCVFTWSVNSPIDVDYYNNLVISNNIFSFSPFANPNLPAIINSNKSSVIINNNIFTGYHQGVSFDNVYYAQFSNNIFFGKSPQGCGNSVFSNNLSYANANTLLPPLPLSNTGQNNLDSIDPQFESIPVNTFTFSYSYDFRLKSTSLGKNAGTDGTDIGIFGGAFPMPVNNNAITGESRLPQVYYMNILNNVIDQNTPLNVTVKARKMN